MNIKGGALEFDIIANNGQINSALDETKKRVQGFTDATVEGGERMEAAYKEAAAQIEAAFKDIDTMAAIHSNAISDLEKEYARLGEAAGAAFMKGTAKGDEEYRALTAKQQAVKGEIEQRKALLREVENTADALYKEEQALKATKKQVEKNTEVKTTFRTQIRNVREELIRMEQAGLRGTKQFAAMQQELGRLQNAMDDATQQARVLANNEANFQGIITGMSGVAGAFSAAQGAVGLFAGENENLQKIMVKVQSLMAITIGLQQVSMALNKDSAFMLVTVAKAKQLVATSTLFLGKAFVKMGLSATAAKVAVAGLYATLTLGLSLAITGIVHLINKHNERQAEAKKKAEETAEAYKKQQDRLADLAKGYAEQVATIATLRAALESENYTYNEKIKIIKKLQDIIPNYTAKLNDEGRVIWDNKAAIDAYLTSLEKTLRFKAAMEDLTEQYKALYMIEKNGMKGGTAAGQKTMNIGGKEVKYFDANELAKMHGLKDATDVSPQVLEQWRKQAEGIGKITETVNEQQKAKIKGNIDDIVKYITDNELLDLTAPDNTGNQKDPYIEQLEKRKAQYELYFKWVNSKDDILQKTAQTEFAGLLKEGSSYLDYLQRQRDQLTNEIGSGEATKKQADELRKLNNAIATETKNTVLAGFEKELQTQLNGAGSILEMLTVLEAKRKELTGDGSELDNGKKDIISKAQEDVNKEAKEKTDRLLSDYAGFLSEKLTFEANYAENSRLLNEQLAKAKTDDERRIVLEALANLDKEKKKYSKSSGNEDYDALVEEYKTYQQKCADISADYDEKIALATQQKNEALVVKLQEAKNKALSSVALQELTDSGAWEQLFGNLDDLTTAQIQALIAKIEAQKAQLGVELDPADLNVVLEKLREAKNEIQTRNPFKALSTALKDYKKDASKANLSEVFKSVGATADLVKGSFDAVTGALANMGLAGDEVTQQLLGDIGEMIGSAGQLAEGIATGNPLGIIQGSIGLISSVFDVFNFRDRRAERAIKKHAAAVAELERTYKALEHAVDKALGETVYDNQKALISNMRQQQAHLREMWQAEEGKKKTDRNKVNQYKEQYAELGRSIEDTIAEITESITQTSAKDLATQLADAIAEAYADGFSSEKVASAINKVTNQVLQNAVKNALKKQFLEQRLQAAVKQLQYDMGFDDEGGGSFDGLTPEEQQRFKDRVNSIAQGYAEALKLYEDLFKGLEDNSDPTTSLSGAIKGASQESIDLLAGQTNAVRVNQVQEIDLLRQQLIRLANIDGKLSVSNRHLEQIEKNTSGSASDPLRAQGITM